LDAAESLTEHYHDNNRLTVLKAVAERRKKHLYGRVLALTPNNARGASLLAEIAPILGVELRHPMRVLAGRMPPSGSKASALVAIAKLSHEPERSSILQEAVETALAVTPDEKRVRALRIVLAATSGEPFAQLFMKAVELAETIDHVDYSTIKAVDHRALELFELSQIAPEELRAALLQKTTAAAATMNPTSWQAELIQKIRQVFGKGVAIERRKRARSEPNESEEISKPDPEADETSRRASDAFTRQEKLMARFVALPSESNRALTGLLRAVHALEPASRLPFFELALQKADEPTRVKLLKSLRALVTKLGARYGVADDVSRVARTILSLPGNRADDALDVVRAVRSPKARGEALASIARLLPPSHERVAIDEALEAAALFDDSAEQKALLKELRRPAVDLGAVAADVLVVARAGPYAEDFEDEGGFDYFDDAEPEEAEPQESEPEAKEASVERYDELLDRIAAMQALSGERRGENSREEGACICRLVEILPAENVRSEVWERALALTRRIRYEDSRREALEALLPRLPEGLWQQAFEVAASIRDHDERAEASIAFALAVDDPALLRNAQLQGLEAIRRAQNEDDYPEPFLRLAYHLPHELLPLALEVAADLYVDDSVERRAEAFMGLAGTFQHWHASDRAAAGTAWRATLHRLADRPRATLLRDFVGFQYLARVLTGPANEADLLKRLRRIVTDVGKWWA
jgi:hypothetical protein